MGAAECWAEEFETEDTASGGGEGHELELLDREKIMVRVHTSHSKSRLMPEKRSWCVQKRSVNVTISKLIGSKRFSSMWPRRSNSLSTKKRFCMCSSRIRIREYTFWTSQSGSSSSSGRWMRFAGKLSYVLSARALISLPLLVKHPKAC